MSRPRKSRRICHMPLMREFVPTGKKTGKVTMTVDEYETIRLLDHEGLTQEQCAAQMNVARQTVTLIYESARRKVADCIVNCKELSVKGGDFVLCENAEDCCGKKCIKVNCGHCQDNECNKIKQENKE